MTQLNDKDHAAQMADMKSFDEEMPSIGIFWYDPQDHSLFGVGKKELTPREVEEARAKGVDVINYPPSTFNSQLSTIQAPVPYGRVVWNIDKFMVHVGKWAEPVQDEFTQLIEDTFHLPYFEFVYDEHWDLGHGWSGDMPGTK